MMTSINGFSAPDMTALYQSLFRKVDSDSSGGIDKTEFQTAVSGMTGKDAGSEEIDAMFAKLDTDGDGTVDDSEMMAALKEMGEQRQAMMPPPPPPPMDGQDERLSDDDRLSALFKSLINTIQSGSAYNQSGVLSFGSSTYESLMNVFA